MATTSPDGINYPTNADAQKTLEQRLQDTATSVQTALTHNTVAVVASAAARDSRFPTPTQGDGVWRSDKGWEERYFGTFNSSTNPGGATPAGWYPVAGAMPFARANKTATQAISSNPSKVTINTITQHGGFSISGDAVYIPVTGSYFVTGSYYSYDAVNTFRGNAIRINGTTEYLVQNTSAKWSYPISSGYIDFVTGDLISSWANGDNTHTIQVITNTPVLSLKYVGPSRI